VRRICPHCAEPYTPSADELLFFERSGGSPDLKFRRGTGCNLCGQTGYFERVGVYEVLRITEEIRELIVRGASHSQIQQVAHQQGMRGLLEQSIRLVSEGVTTIAEILRTVYVAA
jgi:type IV pilus assembly protein PilB